MDQWTIGIVGVGAMGSPWSRFINFPSWRAVGLYDIDRERSAKLLGKRAVEFTLADLVSTSRCIILASDPAIAKLPNYCSQAGGSRWFPWRRELT